VLLEKEEQEGTLEDPEEVAITNLLKHMCRKESGKTLVLELMA